MIKSYIPKFREGCFVCGHCGECVYFPYMTCELGCKKEINWKPLAKNWRFEGEPKAFKFKYEHFIKDSIVECISEHGIASGYLKIGARYKVIDLFYEGGSIWWEAWTLDLETLSTIYESEDYIYEPGHKCDYQAKLFRLVDIEKEKKTEAEELKKLRKDIEKSIRLKVINERLKTSNHRMRYLLGIIKEEILQRKEQT